MKVLIDTNVALDVLGNRMPFADAASAVLTQCETKKITGYVSATTVTDIYYVLSKAVPDHILLHTILEKFLSVVELVDVTKREIFNALKLRSTDFEDMVQSECAASCGADYIITRNGRDFAGSKVKAIAPDDFLKLDQ